MKYILTLLVIFTGILIFHSGPVTALGQTKSNNEVSASDSGWPRRFTVDGTAFAIYQPQIEEWASNRFTARSAISVTESRGKQLSYGVLWFNARTEIDKANRLVTLNDFEVTKVSLPTVAPDKIVAYQTLLQANAKKKDDVIALDRLLADLSVNQANTDSGTHEVKNDAPQVFFSTKPAILILIDGSPELRPVENTKLQRIINTRVLILQDPSNRQFYLRLMDGWLEAESLTGPWRIADKLPTDITKALEAAVASKQVDLLDGAAAGSAKPKPSLSGAAKENAIPEIHVTTSPAELLQTQGEPQIVPIEGTQLVYVANTENDIFVYTRTQNHYILVAGRWFSSQSMKGPWTHVPAEKLPSDFAKIPPAHLKANVLASVPGTPQAKEALIANSIPQTATIKLSAATLTIKYDGAPRFKRIENTSLQYAVNTATPVIAVNSNSYYAVQNGVWFAANAPTGPWAVATSVPAVIYSIPPSSSVHYVTYVKIYGSTSDVVYVGYTPGYYGTVVSSSGVVVYGTG